MSFELYNIPQGQIMIAFSDRNLSVGTLELNPKQELSKHNRPVLESLFQIKGKCMMKLVEDDGSIKEVILNEGDSLDICAEKYHLHTNPFDEASVTFWKADGDITQIIEDIRSSNEM